jgi:hypothetical protein
MGLGDLGMAMDPLSLIFSLIGAGDQQNMDREAMEENIKRWEEMKAINADTRSRVMPRIRRNKQEELGLLKGRGAFEREEVGRRADDRLDTIQGRRHASVRGATAASDVLANSGETARQSSALESKLTGERLGVVRNANDTENRFDVDLAGQLMNVTGSRQDVAGQSGWLALASIFGDHAPGPPPPEDNSPSFGEQFGMNAANMGLQLGAGALTGGFGGGGGFSPFGKMNPMQCIDGAAELQTEGGHVTLANVPIGAKVMSANGTFQSVADKDYGKPWDSRRDDFVKIESGGRTLILTEDHVVGGKPAGEWDHEEVGPVHCGDILLADGSDYMANGFVVSTHPNLVNASEEVTTDATNNR